MIRLFRRGWHARSSRLMVVATIIATSTVALASEPAAAADKVVGYPKVKVVDLASGKTVDLASNNGGKLPTLAWFWAPH